MATLGPLIFGSTDPSVIAQANLFSAPTITFGGATSHSASVQYDALKGVNPNGGYLRWLNPSDLFALDLSGQISFEIDNSFLSINVAASGSLGTALGSTMYIMSLADSSGTLELMSLYKASGAGGELFLKFRDSASTTVAIDLHAVVEQGSSATSRNCAVHSAVHDEFIRVTIDWSVSGGNRIVTLSIDNVVYWRKTIAYYAWGAATNNAKFLIGANIFSSSTMTGGYIRNLIVGNSSINWSKTGAVGKILMFGDSTIGETYIQPNHYDGATCYMMARRLAQLGVYIEPTTDLVVSRHVGYFVSATNSPSLNSVLAAATATNPNRAVFFGGTNDCNLLSIIPADFLSSLQNYIDTLAALSSLRSIVVSNVRSVVTYSGAGANFNTIRATANLHLRNVTPATNKPIEHINALTLYNKDVAAPGMYEGWITGDFSASAKTNLHPSYYGMSLEGAAVANVLYEQALANGGGVTAGKLFSMISSTVGVAIN